MSVTQQKTVYFIRHGQSVHNTQPVYQSADAPLSAHGQLQAEAIARRMAELPVDLLVASPLPRASQTAERIAVRSNHTILYSDLFVEQIKPTEMNGKAWTDPTARKTWRAWEASQYDPKLRVSDGENYDDTVARIDKALAFLTGRPESTIAVVTHSHFLRALLARVLVGEALNGSTLQRIQQRVSVENTALTTLRYSDAYEEDFVWRLVSLNDHSHISSL